MTNFPLWPGKGKKTVKIPIDFEVGKALTARLTSPNDSYSAVISRLLDADNSK
jgi:hypothetical protein